ncbi:MAG: phosphoribosylanthranilate isomerase [Bacillota bacterium]|nr:phosphoribosylanthranilate isomerase [Bacillota bacterium]
MCPVRIKVCGIRTLQDALAAVQEGVHALGFVFAPSPRRVTPETAAAIIKELPPFIGKVGVFVNEESGRVREIAAYCGLDTLQFHGEETAAYCRLFHPYKVIKAFPVSHSLSVERCREYGGSAILLDTKYADKKGGGGLVFDWRLALPFCKGTFPLILAGGLNQDNILGALKVLRPFGVDISSGVEKDGLKDQDMIRAFMKQIRRWEYQQISRYEKERVEKE